MPEDASTPTPRPGRQKLRASCDECGAAKLRCDRKQPDCGRCVSHGIACIYGVSRKMGKPPRRRPRSLPAQTPANLIPVTESCDTTNDMIDFDGPIDQSALDLSDLASLNSTEWPPVDLSDARLFSTGPAAFSAHFAMTSIRGSESLPAVDDILPHHECSRKAYDILGKLCLFDNLSFGTPLAADDVPFDQVLRLGREAGEQLSKLLGCSCAPCPSLTFLKASIVSRVLSWYHQATPLSGSITPASIAVGTFKVDDEHVQAALRIQLLLGEMKRAGHLIDQLTTHGTSLTSLTVHDVQSSSGSSDRLYQSLTSWLKSEHARIIHIMRSKLKELERTT